jgi:DNA-directed RNA polymerase specialized sigma24 family protein
MEDGDWAMLPDPASAGEESRWRALRFAIDSLPEAQRMALELAYYHGLSHSQIAEMLEVPLGTVKTRIKLGMDKLRELWLSVGSGDASKREPASVNQAEGAHDDP